MSFNYDFDRLDGYYSTSRTGTISLIYAYPPRLNQEANFM